MRVESVRSWEFPQSHNKCVLLHLLVKVLVTSHLDLYPNPSGELSSSACFTCASYLPATMYFVTCGSPEKNEGVSEHGVFHEVRTDGRATSPVLHHEKQRVVVVCGGITMHIFTGHGIPQPWTI